MPGRRYTFTDWGSRPLSEASKTLHVDLLEDLRAVLETHVGEGVPPAVVTQCVMNLLGDLGAQWSEDPAAFARFIADNFPAVVARKVETLRGRGGAA
jgi:hypothetical protein